MEDEERRKKIREFTFDKCKRGNQGFQRILLQLFGYLGHGKSSFINTAMCVWSNSDYKNHANAAGADEGHTTERLTYPLTENIVLVDNRGCSKMNTYETGEIFAQLANLLPVDKSVDWSKGFEVVNRIVEAEPHVKASDFIAPIFVYSVTNSPTPGLKEEMKEIFDTAKRLTMDSWQFKEQLHYGNSKVQDNEQFIYYTCFDDPQHHPQLPLQNIVRFLGSDEGEVVPIVVLTHRNHENYAEVENMFRDIGVDKFFGVENYTDKNPKKKRETHEAVLQFLYDVISDAQFRVNDRRDADQELIDRKLFVLNYIHQREIELHEANLGRQKDVENVRMEQTFRLWQQEEEARMQKCRQLHKERMERIQGEFARQRLRDQFEHQENMKRMENRKEKKSKKN